MILTFSCLLGLREDGLACMKGDLKEEEHHGDDHPDVNHLYIGGGWQSLGDAYEAEKMFLKKTFNFISYNVASTRSAVKLTCITMSTYSSAKTLLI